MKKSIPYFLLLLFQLPWLIYCQNLITLKYQISDTLLFDVSETQMRDKGSMYLMEKSVQIKVIGTGDLFVVDTLALYNDGFNSAHLYLSMHKNMESDDLEAELGSYFVSFGFFDEDTTFIFGHSMVSDYGFSLAGVRKDLQANEIFAQQSKNKIITYKSNALLAIHQCFLYSPDPEYSFSWLKPVKFVRLSIFHFGAG
ncbi:MAG: hypothetical protein ACOYMF_18025 [Bacteroidales bacterium]